MFYRKLQNYHWNVKGHDFFTIHAKLEEYYNEVNEQIDEIAEHILILNGQPLGTMKDYINTSDIEEAKSWKEADIVHINTVFPDSVLAACLAKMQGKKVVYYGHSTMEDFRNSFIGSNRFAPLFKKWICFCYGLGDIVITPTEYSKGLLKSYGIQKKIYAVSNGVDTEFFQSRNKEKEKQELHEKYKIPMNRKVVVSAGHLIQRKGILDFLKLAKMMPEITFIWFGGGNDSLVTQEVKEVVKKKSENVIFAGYVEAEELRSRRICILQL